MKDLKAQIAVAQISTSGAMALPSVAFAVGLEAQRDFRSTDFIKEMVSQHRDHRENSARQPGEDAGEARPGDANGSGLDMHLEKAGRDLGSFIMTRSR